jgi:hypothetical protein
MNLRISISSACARMRPHIAVEFDALRVGAADETPMKRR